MTTTRKISTKINTEYGQFRSLAIYSDHYANGLSSWAIVTKTEYANGVTVSFRDDPISQHYADFAEAMNALGEPWTERDANNVRWCDLNA